MKYFLAILLYISFVAYAQKDQKFDLYILIGQSNMAGRGVITPENIEEGNKRVYMLDKQNKWVHAKHPVHFDKPGVVGVGPGLSFGIAMAKSNRSKKTGLIPCAVGGTSIELWQPGAYDAATKTHPYDDAVARIQAAMKQGVVRGIIWHQGESDSSPEKAKLYLDKLEELILRLRRLTGDKTPFVVGELGRYKGNYAFINQQLALLPAKIPFTALVTSEGLNHKGDTTHFDSKSAQELGRRYAQKMLQLQKQSSKGFTK